MIADDNVDAAESLAEMLRMMGNSVHQVSDGQQAVESAAMFQPDVVLLDIGMPKAATRLVDASENNLGARTLSWSL